MKKPERFINPYNFVGLGEGVERKTYEEHESGNLTGKIKCTLTVKTPLAIPDTEKKQPENIEVKKAMGKNGIEKHYHYPFYRIGDIPVIPGSQLRGVVRSAYETLSNSCFSVYNEAFDILSSRSSAIRKPGIIKYSDGQYRLYKADMKKFKNVVQFNEYEPEELEIKRIWYGSESDNEKKRRMDAEVENGKNPLKYSKTINKYYVFSNPDYEVECCNLEQAIADYNINFDIYLTNASKKDSVKNTAFTKYSRNKNKEVIPLGKKDSSQLYPVFYYEVQDGNGNNYVYLLPSQMGRTVYKNRVKDLLGTYSSCIHEKSGKICSACYLFGVITKKFAYASKIRFSDAKLSSEKFYSEKDVTLYELSSPKITSTEFYSKKPGKCKYWTYDYMIKDYYGDNSRIEDEEIQLCKTELNGRKYYLHYPNLSKSDYNDTQKTGRNSSMELGEAGNEFTFDVYFENISKKQLQELVWTLAIGDNDKNSKQQFKLGHGKPLGLGSVKITVDDIETRSFDKDSLKYTVENLNVSEMISENPFDCNSKYFKDFMLITNVDTACGHTISYPIVDDGKDEKTNANAVHQWFTHNRRAASGTGVGWNLKCSLPPIDSDDLSLPAYKNFKK